MGPTITFHWWGVPFPPPPQHLRPWEAVLSSIYVTTYHTLKEKTYYHADRREMLCIEIKQLQTSPPPPPHRLISRAEHGYMNIQPPPPPPPPPINALFLPLPGWVKANIFLQKKKYVKGSVFITLINFNQ